MKNIGAICLASAGIFTLGMSVGIMMTKKVLGGRR